MSLWTLNGLEKDHHLNSTPVTIICDEGDDDRVTVRAVDNSFSVRAKRKNLFSTCDPKITYEDFKSAICQTKESINPQIRSFSDHMSNQRYQDALKTASAYIRDQHPL